MRKLLLAAVAFGGLLGLAGPGASAAPVTTGLHIPVTAEVSHVDWYWNHHHWHHRRWYHGHWRYWD
jgi:hypothetical protein